ncbi:uncharacterized protein Eint_060495 [Encephalitozoon intestinalis ATCC 50506]|uniref:Uncharacterized protein n=1 Tax=Encephalitozoon intestinalis (strain ATCC 50506) TaxID=876142 RepID=W8PKH3_ENCIT|nr:uncharacterized protein Eint_060495 [Encephalitozoon intestinalis ATCC 50506]AHL30115.1 hypothetical protein Eint_060495 [Encephalitozoon intestinalis ATCC 50506]UTX45392.1 hypothetical protein GPK93_06g09440 [Encephalitozoon intestinalis]
MKFIVGIISIFAVSVFSTSSLGTSSSRTFTSSRYYSGSSSSGSGVTPYSSYYHGYGVGTGTTVDPFADIRSGALGRSSSIHY